MTEGYQCSHRIAGYNFNSYSQPGLVVTPDPRYRNFQAQYLQDSAISIHIFKQPHWDPKPYHQHTTIPEFQILGGVVYQATGRNWEIWSGDQDTLIRLPQKQRQHPSEIVLSQGEQPGNIQICTYGAKEFNLFRYPMDILLLYHLSRWHPQFIVHASAWVLNNQGFLCLGESGAGKSTMAALAGEQGARVIQDDRILIRKLAGQWLMYPIPISGNEKPSPHPLHHIYRIRHGKSNVVQTLTAMGKITNLLPHVVQFPAWIKPYYNSIQTLTNLLVEIPLSTLLFKPSRAVINYLEHESKS